ncbi:MAG: flagellar protein export ATPase FliI [Dethiobacteria bacterium]|nr:flagellar protein export ATPase FliI [Bacillota bacterium]
MPAVNLARYRPLLKELPRIKPVGRVRDVVGLVVEVSGINPFIGEVCYLAPLKGEPLAAEVVGFRRGYTLLMPLGELQGVNQGCPVYPSGEKFQICVGPNLLGKVFDGLGRPLDGTEAVLQGEKVPVEADPPNPLSRRPVDEPLVTGIRAIDGLLTCGQGQRVGIFSGSGVGKSTLLGMIARNSEAEVNVIALIGERGREVGDFLRYDLGEEGLRRSVVVVSTSDRPALERVRGALVAMTIAEYFRAQGKKVILMMDSLTRLAMAQREIGLAVGEPPAAKGYTPSVFALLPRYLERSGTAGRGSITGFYTVLVDGDDLNDPIADAVRGILDGHFVLSRRIAAQNHYPAIDILQSNSRLMPRLADAKHQQAAGEVRNLLSIYEEAEDLINVGAYKKGSNAAIDRAIERRQAILEFLRQEAEKAYSWEETLTALNSLLDS